jgi:CheY-like chemotaxis protein
MHNYKGKKVLVVDNSRWIARLIKNQLTEIGFEDELVSIATDGHQAFLILDLKEFDLVTSGLYLRAKNGLDLLNKLRTDSRERMKDIPFVVISAERTEEFIDNLAKGGGANGYLTKPFLNDELAEMVDRVTEKGNTQFVRLDQKYKPKSILYDPSLDDIGIHPKVISGFVESTVEAFGQYLVTAVPEKPESGNGAKGDLVVSIDFVDDVHEIQVVILVYFPLGIACKIYETIFGEVDMEQVKGVVQELSNIIGGMAKIKAAESAHEYLKLTNGGHPVDPREKVEMHFKLGLPETRDNGKGSLKLEGDPRFTVPFVIDQQKAYLQVYIQKA